MQLNFGKSKSPQNATVKLIDLIHILKVRVKYIVGTSTFNIALTKGIREGRQLNLFHFQSKIKKDNSTW